MLISGALSWIDVFELSLMPAVLSIASVTDGSSGLTPMTMLPARLVNVIFVGSNLIFWRPPAGMLLVIVIV
jgi:hypothetical protein